MLAIPNFSEGRDPVRIAALAQALTSVPGVRLLDIHSDPDHNRTRVHARRRRRGGAAGSRTR